jgi:hypothetical protein
MLLKLLDIFLYLLHVALMGFVMFGWLWSPLAIWHFSSLVVMGIVWIIIGAMGLWNCPLTNFHWKIKEKRGQTGMPVSFVNYFLNQVTGKKLAHKFVQTLLLFIYFSALFLSGILIFTGN